MVTIPVSLLLLQVMGLILFFVGVMAGLLVERQADVITILRNRGASRRQIIGSFVTQSFGLALLALVAGPLLAILATRLLVQATLSAADQQALNVIGRNPLPVALMVGWYALVAALCAVVTMMLAIRGSASRDVLEMRRQSGRATRQPFWQRIYLDVVAVIIALSAFVFWLYISNSGALAAQTLILLLALASSFASFALGFITSETQHAQAIAAYETGADFSGVPLNLDYIDHPAQQTAAYRAIPGVTSATVGFASDAQAPTTAMTVSLRAVDASTFAQTAIWTSQDSSQPLSALKQQLLAHRPSARAGQSVPAVVDALTWQRLNLRVGARFTLQLDSEPITFTALAEIEHIPTVDDSLASGSSSDFTGVTSYVTDTSSGEFYTLQHLLPTQVVVPDLLVLSFVALVGICAGAIWMMARVASRPSISQTLRLNAD